GRTDRDHVVAAGGAEVGRIGRRVAGRHHHGGAARHRAVDGILVGRVAGAIAAQAHVDDLGRIGVGRDPGHGTAGRPGDRVGDIGQVAAALAEHAHRQHPGLVGHAGHADAVVGGFGDGPGDVGAVPGTVLGQRTGVALVVVLHPVALVQRTRDAIIGG